MNADVKSTEEKARRECCSSCCFHYVRVSLTGLLGYRPTLSAGDREQDVQGETTEARYVCRVCAAA